MIGLTHVVFHIVRILIAEEHMFSKVLNHSIMLYFSMRIHQKIHETITYSNNSAT